MLFLFFNSLLISSEPKSTPDENVHFKLTGDSVFINHSIDGYDTIAVAELQVLYDLKSSDSIGEIVVEFQFDNAQFYACYKDSNNWSGNIEHDDITGGKQIRLYGGDAPFPEAYTTFAYLQFTLDCIDESGSAELDFTGELIHHYIELKSNGEHLTPKYDSNLINGALYVSEYVAKFDVDATSYEGALGKKVTVPILAESNHRIHSTDQYLLFNKNFLDSAELIVDPALWDDNNSSVTVNDDTLFIHLTNSNGNYAPNFSSGEPACSLRFYAKPDFVWDGNTAYFSYISDTGFTVPYSGPPDWKCDSLRAVPDSLTGGEIYIESYVINLKIDLDCANCDNTVSASDTNVTFNLSARANCDFGHIDQGPTSIPMVILLRSDGHFTSGVFPPTNLNDSIYFNGSFQPRAGEEDYIKYNSINYGSRPGIVPHTVGEYVDLFRATIHGQFAPENYTDTAFTLNLLHAFNGIADTTWAYDFTGFRRMDSLIGNMNYEEGDTIYAKVGEFAAVTANNGTCTGSQDIYVRCREDIDSVCVQVSGSGTIDLDTIIAANGVAGESKFVGNHTFEFYSDSNFSGIDATGTDSVKIATAYFSTGASDPPDTITITPELTGKVILSGTDNFISVERGAQLTVISTTSCHSGTPAKSNDIGQPDDNNLMPTEFALHQNRPNPFNPTTVIPYDIPKTTHVTIEIFNILGQRITVLVDTQKGPGRHEAVWDGCDGSGNVISSGIYFYRMTAGNYTESKKMQFMK
jgi:hypothetical protein